MENSMKILTAEEITEKHKKQAQQYLDEHTPKDGSESSLEFWLINRGLRTIETMEAKYSDLLKKYEDLFQSEPVEAVEEPSKTETWYQYFVSYIFTKKGVCGIGHGNAKLKRKSRISDYEDIENIQNELTEFNEVSAVSLINFIELYPIEEEVEGDNNETD